MKTNKQNKNEKEVSIVYGDDNSINVNIFNNKILIGVVGSFDNNLKELEKLVVLKFISEVIQSRLKVTNKQMKK